MKIALFEIKGWEKAFMTKLLKGHTLQFYEEPLTEANIAKAKTADVISVFIYSRVTQKVIEGIPKLKLITTRSTGFDHVDIATAKKKNIPVCSVPFYGENSVAEHAFALLISLSRNIHKAYDRTIKDNFSIEGLKGFDLKGKTVGVIGGGHIGLHMARMCKAFDMKVLLFDIRRDEFMSNILGYEYVDMDTLLKQADVISLHVPYNEHTHHLINKDAVKKMKKGVILINTARGGVVSTEALHEGLKSGKIGGAGLDVIEGEEMVMKEEQYLKEYDPTKLHQIVEDHVVINHPNVIFTPHIAFYTQEALERILLTTAENIEGFSKGKIANKVN